MENGAILTLCFFYVMIGIDAAIKIIKYELHKNKVRNFRLFIFLFIIFLTALLFWPVYMYIGFSEFLDTDK